MRYKLSIVVVVASVSDNGGETSVFSKTRVVDGLDTVQETVDAARSTLRTLKSEVEVPLRDTLSKVERGW